MPTGYTAAIKDGIDFKTYGLSCARAFGALVMMRDEPSNAEIPDGFKPSEYSKNALQKAKEHFAKLNDLTKKGWEQMQKSEFDKQVEQYGISQKEEIDLLQKYHAMLNQAIEWRAPTEEHKELRAFMIKQIEDSIEWDCNHYSKGKYMPVLLPLDEYVSLKTEAALADIKYHNNAWAEEQERTDNRNKWIKDLRNSL